MSKKTPLDINKSPDNVTKTNHSDIYKVEQDKYKDKYKLDKTNNQSSYNYPIPSTTSKTEKSISTEKKDMPKQNGKAVNIKEKQIQDIVNQVSPTTKAINEAKNKQEQLIQEDRIKNADLYKRFGRKKPIAKKVDQAPLKAEVLSEIEEKEKKIQEAIKKPTAPEFTLADISAAKRGVFNLENIVSYDIDKVNEHITEDKKRIASVISKYYNWDPATNSVVIKSFGSDQEYARVMQQLEIEFQNAQAKWQSSKYNESPHQYELTSFYKKLKEGIETANKVREKELFTKSKEHGFDKAPEVKYNIEKDKLDNKGILKSLGRGVQSALTDNIVTSTIGIDNLMDEYFNTKDHEKKNVLKDFIYNIEASKDDKEKSFDLKYADFINKVDELKNISVQYLYTKDPTKKQQLADEYKRLYNELYGDDKPIDQKTFIDKIQKIPLYKELRNEIDKINKDKENILKDIYDTETTNLLDEITTSVGSLAGMILDPTFNYAGKAVEAGFKALHYVKKINDATKLLGTGKRLTTLGKIALNELKVGKYAKSDANLLTSIIKSVDNVDDIQAVKKAQDILNAIENEGKIIDIKSIPNSHPLKTKLRWISDIVGADKAKLLNQTYELGSENVFEATTKLITQGAVYNIIQNGGEIDPDTLYQTIVSMGTAGVIGTAFENYARKIASAITLYKKYNQLPEKLSQYLAKAQKLAWALSQPISGVPIVGVSTALTNPELYVNIFNEINNEAAKDQLFRVFISDFAENLLLGFSGLRGITKKPQELMDVDKLLEAFYNFDGFKEIGALNLEDKSQYLIPVLDTQGNITQAKQYTINPNTNMWERLNKVLGRSPGDNTPIKLSEIYKNNPELLRSKLLQMGFHEEVVDDILSKDYEIRPHENFTGFMGAKGNTIYVSTKDYNIFDYFKDLRKDEKVAQSYLDNLNDPLDVLLLHELQHLYLSNYVKKGIADSEAGLNTAEANEINLLKEELNKIKKNLKKGKYKGTTKEIAAYLTDDKISDYEKIQELIAYSFTGYVKPEFKELQKHLLNPIEKLLYKVGFRYGYETLQDKIKRLTPYEVKEGPKITGINYQAIEPSIRLFSEIPKAAVQNNSPIDVLRSLDDQELANKIANGNFERQATGKVEFFTQHNTGILTNFRKEDGDSYKLVETPENTYTYQVDTLDDIPLNDLIDIIDFNNYDNNGNIIGEFDAIKFVDKNGKKIILLKDDVGKDALAAGFFSKSDPNKAKRTLDLLQELRNATGKNIIPKTTEIKETQKTKEQTKRERLSTKKQPKEIDVEPYYEVLKEKLPGLRKDGSQLWEHSKRVGDLVKNRVTDEHVVAAAYFHDLLEDMVNEKNENVDAITKQLNNKFELEQIIKSKFPHLNAEKVIHLVESVSYRPEFYDLPKDERKKKQIEIWKQSTDKDEIAIKIADIEDNLANNPTEYYKEWAIPLLRDLQETYTNLLENKKSNKLNNLRADEANDILNQIRQQKVIIEQQQEKIKEQETKFNQLEQAIKELQQFILHNQGLTAKGPELEVKHIQDEEQEIKQEIIKEQQKLSTQLEEDYLAYTKEVNPNRINQEDNRFINPINTSKEEVNKSKADKELSSIDSFDFTQLVQLDPKEREEINNSKIETEDNVDNDEILFARIFQLQKDEVINNPKKVVEKEPNKAIKLNKEAVIDAGKNQISLNEEDLNQDPSYDDIKDVVKNIPSSKILAFRTEINKRLQENQSLDDIFREIIPDYDTLTPYQKHMLEMKFKAAYVRPTVDIYLKEGELIIDESSPYNKLINNPDFIRSRQEQFKENVENYINAFSRHTNIPGVTATLQRLADIDNYLFINTFRPGFNDVDIDKLSPSIVANLIEKGYYFTIRDANQVLIPIEPKLKHAFNILSLLTPNKKISKSYEKKLLEPFKEHTNPTEAALNWAIRTLIDFQIDFIRYGVFRALTNADVNNYNKDLIEQKKAILNTLENRDYAKIIDFIFNNQKVLSDSNSIDYSKIEEYLISKYSDKYDAAILRPIIKDIIKNTLQMFKVTQGQKQEYQNNMISLIHTIFGEKTFDGAKDITIDSIYDFDPNVKDSYLTYNRNIKPGDLIRHYINVGNTIHSVYNYFYTGMPDNKGTSWADVKKHNSKYTNITVSSRSAKYSTANDLVKISSSFHNISEDELKQKLDALNIKQENPNDPNSDYVLNSIIIDIENLTPELIAEYPFLQNIIPQKDPISGEELKYGDSHQILTDSEIGKYVINPLIKHNDAVAYKPIYHEQKKDVNNSLTLKGMLYTPVQTEQAGPGNIMNLVNAIKKNVHIVNLSTSSKGNNTYEPEIYRYTDNNGIEYEVVTNANKVIKKVSIIENGELKELDEKGLNEFKYNIFKNMMETGEVPHFFINKIKITGNNALEVKFGNHKLGYRNSSSGIAWLQIAAKDDMNEVWNGKEDVLNELKTIHKTVQQNLIDNNSQLIKEAIKLKRLLGKTIDPNSIKKGQLEFEKTKYDNEPLSVYEKQILLEIMNEGYLDADDDIAILKFGMKSEDVKKIINHVIEGTLPRSALYDINGLLYDTSIYSDNSVINKYINKKLSDTVKIANEHSIVNYAQADLQSLNIAFDSYKRHNTPIGLVNELMDYFDPVTGKLRNDRNGVIIAEQDLEYYNNVVVPAYNKKIAAYNAQNPDKQIPKLKKLKIGDYILAKKIPVQDAPTAMASFRIVGTHPQGMMSILPSKYVLYDTDSDYDGDKFHFILPDMNLTQDNYDKLTALYNTHPPIKPTRNKQAIAKLNDPAYIQDKLGLEFNDKTFSPIQGETYHKTMLNINQNVGKSILTRSLIEDALEKVEWHYNDDNTRKYAVIPIVKKTGETKSVHYIVLERKKPLDPTDTDAESMTGALVEMAVNPYNVVPFDIQNVMLLKDVFGVVETNDAEPDKRTMDEIISNILLDNLYDPYDKNSLNNPEIQKTKDQRLRIKLKKFGKDVANDLLNYYNKITNYKILYDMSKQEEASEKLPALVKNLAKENQEGINALVHKLTNIDEYDTLNSEILDKTFKHDKLNAIYANWRLQNKNRELFDRLYTNNPAKDRIVSVEDKEVDGVKITKNADKILPYKALFDFLTFYANSEYFDEGTKGKMQSLFYEIANVFNANGSKFNVTNTGSEFADMLHNTMEFVYTKFVNKAGYLDKGEFNNEVAEIINDVFGAYFSWLIQVANFKETTIPTLGGYKLTNLKTGAADYMVVKNRDLVLVNREGEPIKDKQGNEFKFSIDRMFNNDGTVSTDYNAFRLRMREIGYDFEPHNVFKLMKPKDILIKRTHVTDLASKLLSKIADSLVKKGFKLADGTIATKDDIVGYLMTSPNLYTQIGNKLKNETFLPPNRYNVVFSYYPKDKINLLTKPSLKSDNYYESEGVLRTFLKDGPVKLITTYANEEEVLKAYKDDPNINTKIGQMFFGKATLKALAANNSDINTLRLFHNLEKEGIRPKYGNIDIKSEFNKSYFTAKQENIDDDLLQAGLFSARSSYRNEAEPFSDKYGIHNILHDLIDTKAIYNYLGEGADHYKQLLKRIEELTNKHFYDLTKEEAKELLYNISSLLSKKEFNKMYGLEKKIHKSRKKAGFNLEQYIHDLIYGIRNVGDYLVSEHFIENEYKKPGMQALVAMLDVKYSMDQLKRKPSKREIINLFGENTNEYYLFKRSNNLKVYSSSDRNEDESILTMNHHKYKSLKSFLDENIIDDGTSKTLMEGSLGNLVTFTTWENGKKMIYVYEPNVDKFKGNLQNENVKVVGMEELVNTMINSNKGHVMIDLGSTHIMASDLFNKELSRQQFITAVPMQYVEYILPSERVNEAFTQLQGLAMSLKQDYVDYLEEIKNLDTSYFSDNIKQLLEDYYILPTINEIGTPKLNINIGGKIYSIDVNKLHSGEEKQRADEMYQALGERLVASMIKEKVKEIEKFVKELNSDEYKKQYDEDLLQMFREEQENKLNLLREISNNINNKEYIKQIEKRLLESGDETNLKLYEEFKPFFLDVNEHYVKKILKPYITLYTIQSSVLNKVNKIKNRIIAHKQKLKEKDMPKELEIQLENVIERIESLALNLAGITNVNKLFENNLLDISEKNNFIFTPLLNHLISSPNSIRARALNLFKEISTINPRSLDIILKYSDQAYYLIQQGIDPNEVLSMFRDDEKDSIAKIIEFRNELNNDPILNKVLDILLPYYREKGYQIPDKNEIGTSMLLGFLFGMEDNIDLSNITNIDFSKIKPFTEVLTDLINGYAVKKQSYKYFGASKYETDFESRKYYNYAFNENYFENEIIKAMIDIYNNPETSKLLEDNLFEFQEKLKANDIETIRNVFNLFKETISKQKMTQLDVDHFFNTVKDEISKAMVYYEDALRKMYLREDYSKNEDPLAHEATLNMLSKTTRNKFIHSEYIEGSDLSGLARKGYFDEKNNRGQMMMLTLMSNNGMLTDVTGNIIGTKRVQIIENGEEKEVLMYVVHTNTFSPDEGKYKDDILFVNEDAVLGAQKVKHTGKLTEKFVVRQLNKIYNKVYDDVMEAVDNLKFNDASSSFYLPNEYGISNINDLIERNKIIKLFDAPRAINKLMTDFAYLGGKYGIGMLANLTEALWGGGELLYGAVTGNPVMSLQGTQKMIYGTFSILTNFFMLIRLPFIRGLQNRLGTIYAMINLPDSGYDDPKNINKLKRIINYTLSTVSNKQANIDSIKARESLLGLLAEGDTVGIATSELTPQEKENIMGYLKLYYDYKAALYDYVQEIHDRLKNNNFKRLDKLQKQINKIRRYEEKLAKKGANYNAKLPELKEDGTLVNAIKLPLIGKVEYEKKALEDSKDKVVGVETISKVPELIDTNEEEIVLLTDDNELIKYNINLSDDYYAIANESNPILMINDQTISDLKRELKELSQMLINISRIRVVDNLLNHSAKAITDTEKMAYEVARSNVTNALHNLKKNISREFNIDYDEINNSEFLTDTVVKYLTELSIGKYDDKTRFQLSPLGRILTKFSHYQKPKLMDALRDYKRAKELKIIKQEFTRNVLETHEKIKSNKELWELYKKYGFPAVDFVILNSGQNISQKVAIAASAKLLKWASQGLAAATLTLLTNQGVGLLFGDDDEKKEPNPLGKEVQYANDRMIQDMLDSIFMANNGYYGIWIEGAGALLSTIMKAIKILTTSDNKKKEALKDMSKMNKYGFDFIDDMTDDMIETFGRNAGMGSSFIANVIQLGYAGLLNYYGDDEAYFKAMKRLNSNIGTMLGKYSLFNSMLDYEMTKMNLTVPDLYTYYSNLYSGQGNLRRAMQSDYKLREYLLKGTERDPKLNKKKKRKKKTAEDFGL